MRTIWTIWYHTPRTIRTSLAAVCLFLALFAHVADAATSYTWTGATDNDWNTTSNWSPSTGFPGSSAGDTANLSGSVATVNVSSSPANAVTVNLSTANGGWTLQGSALTITSSGLTSSNTSGTNTINLVLAGTGGVVKATGNGGTLTLANANTYTGNTTLSSGATININNARAFGTGALIFSGNATIDNTSGSAISLANNNALTLMNGSLTFTGTNSLDFGTGLVTLSASRTFTIHANTLTLGGAVSGAGFNITKSGSGTLIFNGAIGTTTGGVTMSSGTLTLAGTNTYSGGTTFSAGIININNDTGLGTGPLLINGNNSFDNTSGQPISIANAITLNGSPTFIGTNSLITSGSATITGGSRTLTVNTNTLTIGGGLLQDATARNFTKAGTGTLVLNGASGYTGTTTLSAGTVIVGANNALANSALTMASSGNVKLVLGNSTGAVSQTFTYSADTVISTGSTLTNSIVGGNSSNSTLTFNTTAGFSATNDALLGGTGTNENNLTVTINGAGTTVFRGQSATYQGDTTINSGATLRLDVANALAFGSGKGNVIANGTFSLGGSGISQSINGLSGSGTITSPFNSLHTLRVGNNDATSTFDGVMNNGPGTTNLIKTGTGTLTLTAPNSHNNTSVTGGTLKNGIANTLPVGGLLTVSGSGATYDLNGFAQTIGGLSDGGTSDGVVTNSVATPMTLTVNNSADNTFSGVISGGANVALIKNNVFKLTLSGANTYTGGTTVNNGRFILGANNVLADTGILTVTGGFFEIGSFNDIVGAVSLTGGTITNNASTGTLTSNTSFSVESGTISAKLAGTAALTKTTSGTVTLSAISASTYSGGTNVNVGTLQITTSNILPSSGAVNVNGGTLGISIYNETVGSVTLTSGSITGSSGSLNGAFYNVQSGSISAILAGSGSLTKTTSGTVTLSGANSYNGGTNANGGTLLYGASNILTGAVTVNGGTLDISTFSDSVNAVTLIDGNISGTTGILTGSSYSVQNGAISAILAGSATVTLTKTTAGTVVLSGANTYAGKTTISGGMLSISSDSNLGTPPGSPTENQITFSGGTLATTATMTLNTNRKITLNGGTFDVAANTVLTYGGIISIGVPGGLTKTGAGTLLLNGANSHQNGTMVLGGTVGGTGTIQGTATFASGTIHSPGLSPGTQTVAGNYILNSGSKLQIEINGTVAGTSYDQVVVNGTVTLNLPNIGFTLGYAPTIGQSFILIANDSTDAVTNRFNGLPEGSTFDLPFSSTNYTFQITYVGGTGNDVVLTNIASAESTAVELVSFAATTYKDGRWLKWETGEEVDNLGFNVYREQNGKKVRLNSSLIGGSALRVGSGTRLIAGGSYAWPDSSGDSQARYWLEDVDLNGTSTWHGPVKLSLSTADGNSPLQSSPLLGATPLLQPSSSGAFNKAATTSIDSSVEMPFSLTSIPAANQSQQWSLAGQKAVKIAVRKTGWYRVTKSQLTAAGLDVTDFNNVQLYADGQPVSISVGSSYLEFYGVAFDTPTTDTRIYWLVTGNEGVHIGTQTTSTLGSTLAASFPCTVESKPRVVYYSSLLNGEASNFFGPVIYTQAVTQTLLVQNPASSGQMQLEVTFQGVSNGAHQVQVQLNGTVIGAISFSNRSHKVALLTVPLALLNAGSNSVTLTSSGGSDVSLLDSLRLTYPRTYRAVNDRLTFSAQSGDTIRIEGFNLGTGPLRLIDVSNPTNPIEIQGQVQTGSSDRSLTFKASTTSSRLIAFSTSQYDSPTGIISNQPSDWHSAKSADLVIIAHANVKSSVEPLAQLRRQQGYAVQVVDVEDIYDEFSGGAHTPQALKDFLVNAKTTWIKAPRFALLVGDSSLDPRNYGGKGDFDLVPTRLIDTASMETASDEWLADFDDNGLAELSLGRLPVRSAGEATAVVKKIVSYAGFQVKEGKKALFVSDTERGFDFNAASSTVAGLVPPSVSKQFVKRDDGDVATVKAQLIQDINQGPLVASFFGHGSVDTWTGARLLANEDAGSLTNSANLSLILPMTCLNGYFHDPSLDGLAETLLKTPNGGGAAVWASSGMTDPRSQLGLSEELHRQLFKQGTGKPATLGDAIKNAKAIASDGDVLRTWILFGDPTTPILAPTIKTPAVTIGDVSVEEGNSGLTNANFTVQLSWPSDKTVTVNAIPSNGSALAPADYTSGGVRLIFAPGETSKDFSVPIKGDVLDEANESFFVLLSSPVNCSVGRGRAVGTILDDDNSPSISIDNLSIGEGNMGQRVAAFRLKLSAPSGKVVKVTYATEDGIAVAGNDYVEVAPTQIAFSVGNLYTYARVLINGDVLTEPNETFLVNLTSPLNATFSGAPSGSIQAVGTILNDDSAPSLSINDVSISEGNSGTKNLIFTVTLSKASGQSVTVNYATVDGTGRSPGDYGALSGTLTFASNSVLTRTISIPITGDILVESDESFALLLTNAVNATIGRGRGIATILNDDSSTSTD